MALSKFHFAIFAHTDDNQEALWRKITLLLYAEGFRPVFSVLHKETIVAYVKAIEATSAFVKSPTGPSQAAYTILLDAEANSLGVQSDKDSFSNIQDSSEQGMPPDGDGRSRQNETLLGEQSRENGDASTVSAHQSTTEPLNSSSGYDQGTTHPKSVPKSAVDDQILAEQLEEKASLSDES